MIQTIQIPVSEYKKLKDEINLLKDNVLLKKMNTLIEYLYQEKLGITLNDFTEDLTEESINNNWDNEKSVWDDV
ncbi:MAG: hypothetical protein EAZ53_07765 [Bacteroidetes bacterium]|nr:MAG: hypothetical protein EAZ53_07765 [Bacteroidota bacterium]